MKTKYKYIRFDIIKCNGKTSTWSILDRDDKWLGIIKWYSRWKQFCFLPDPSTVFSQDCLVDIIDFIKQLPPCGGEGEVR